MFNLNIDFYFQHSQFKILNDIFFNCHSNLNMLFNTANFCKITENFCYVKIYLFFQSDVLHDFTEKYVTNTNNTKHNNYGSK